MKWPGVAVRAIVQFVVIEIVARLLYATGILFLIAALRRRFGPRRLLVPMYHRISDGGWNSEQLLDVQRGVPVQRFREQLRILRWFGPLMTLDKAYECLNDPRQAGRTFVAVTFDDGYRDSFTVALPELRRVGASATIFPVVRTASGGRPLWWDELTTILARGAMNGSGIAPALAGCTEWLPSPSDRHQLGPHPSRAVMAEFLANRALEMDHQRREQLLDLLADRLAVSDRAGSSVSEYADWEQIRRAADICEIGGHTLDHVVLTTEEPVVVERQITECRRQLERQINRPVCSFAYPNGRYDSTVRQLTQTAGFRLAVTTRHGVNYEGTDPLQLRRVPLNCERPFHLAFKLAFYGWVRRD